MKGALDSLGVKPQERRAVILMLMAFFLIGNCLSLTSFFGFYPRIGTRRIN